MSRNYSETFVDLVDYAWRLGLLGATLVKPILIWFTAHKSIQTIQSAN